jgi:hypothetical protein
VNALVKAIPLVLLATTSVAPAQTKDRVDYVNTRSGKGSLRIEGAMITGTDDYHGVTVYLHGELDPAPARAGAFAAGVLDFAHRETRDSAEPGTAGRISGADILEVGFVPLLPVGAALAEQDFDDPSGVGNARHGLEHGGVEEVEQRGVGTNAEREGQDGDDGEPPSPRQASRGDADVAGRFSSTRWT